MEIRYEALTLTELDDGTLSVIFCEKDAVRVTVPAKIDGRTVTTIGEEAFKDCKRLVSVTLPEGNAWDFEGFSKIEEYAFQNCTALTKITIPDSVYTLARGAFHGCRSLISAKFPRNCHLSAYAFSGCTALKTLSPLSNVSEGLFSGCTALGKITLTDTVSEIDEDAFEHCTALGEMTLPESVKRVGALSFRGCLNLKKVIFLASDGWYASNRYRAEDVAIDVSDPVSNAKRLATADFDDGTVCWYRKNN